MSGGVAPGALTVVKLGGSFAFSPDLLSLLDAMEAAAVPLVIVAGGGPFADTVRLAQPRMRFDERAAHRMALLAMAQYAEALCSLSPRFQVASNLAATRAAIGTGRLPVWSPWPLTDGLETLPESWDLTSDSLAAWLASRLQASRLLLLKHRDPPAGPMNLRQIAKLGIVDPLFPDYARQSGASVCWLGPSQFPALTAILDGREAAGLSLGREIREHHHA